MSDVLTRIIARKREEVAERSARVPLAELVARCADLPPTRGFAAAIEAKIAKGEAGVIAEVKRASPSRGVLRADFDPADIGRSYARGGAACLSVLTDHDFFHGHEDHLVAAREASGLPVLRKDFTIDAWQVHEARALGADAILLIVAALDDVRLQELCALGLDLGMDVLVEVHDDAELERALATPAHLVGINNRDLRTFETTLDTTFRLKDRVPHMRRLVTESGILTRDDAAAMRAAGVHAFLVGEAFMRAPDPGTALRALFAPEPVRETVVPDAARGDASP
jgi:indole-3-glycerol phosphate synthase